MSVKVAGHAAPAFPAPYGSPRVAAGRVVTADVCAVVDVTGLRCQKEAGHWGYVHEADDGVGLASWCVDECDCWMWSSYVPHGFSAEPAADVYPLAVT